MQRLLLIALASVLWTSQEAQAEQGLRPLQAEGYDQRIRPPAYTLPTDVDHRGAEDRLRERQPKGPVDVMSISLFAALLAFFGLAMWQRRQRRRRFVALTQSDDIPRAQVLPDDRRRS